MHMYVSIFFVVFWGFLTPRIAVALAVGNRSSTTNSLDLLFGIKRMGEQTDEVPGLFSNNACIIVKRQKMCRFYKYTIVQEPTGAISGLH